MFEVFCFSLSFEVAQVDFDQHILAGILKENEACQLAPAISVKPTYRG